MMETPVSRVGWQFSWRQFPQAGVMRCERDAERRDLEQSWIHTPALPALADACLPCALRPADVAGRGCSAGGKRTAHARRIARLPDRAEVVVVTARARMQIARTSWSG